MRKSEKYKYKNIHRRNCISLDKNLHKQFTLAVTHDWIIYQRCRFIFTLFSLFLCVVVCLSLFCSTSALKSLAPCHLLFLSLPLAHHFVIFAHFLSVIHPFIHSCFDSISSFDVAKLTKNVNNFFYVIVFQIQLCKML